MKTYNISLSYSDRYKDNPKNLRRDYFGGHIKFDIDEHLDSKGSFNLVHVYVDGEVDDFSFNDIDDLNGESIPKDASWVVKAAGTTFVKRRH